MSFLFYFILRKIFVKLDFTDDIIYLKKGLLLKRSAVLPVKSILKITVKRTLLMRVFRAKEVELSTLCGSVKFYLSRDEQPGFIPEAPSEQIRPSFGEILFGAFIDTRALGGIFLLVAILRKISTIFGSDYSDKIIDALFKTAENVTAIFELLHITIPKAATVIAVFLLAAWITAYMRKVARLSRFRISRNKNMLFVKSGLITLYERAIVLNSDCVRAESSETITTLAARRAPLYLNRVMVCPCVHCHRLPKTLNTLCAMTKPDVKIKPPRRAAFGLCAAPLGWFAAFCGALILVYCSDRFRAAMLLKTALYSGIIVSAYTVLTSLLYMNRSGISVGGRFSEVSSRRGLRLKTAVFPSAAIRVRSQSQSVFQRKSGLCSVRISTVGRRKFKARQLVKSEIPHHTSL